MTQNLTLDDLAHPGLEITLKIHLNFYLSRKSGKSVNSSPVITFKNFSAKYEKSRETVYLLLMRPKILPLSLMLEQDGTNFKPSTPDTEGNKISVNIQKVLISYETNMARGHHLFPKRSLLSLLIRIECNLIELEHDTILCYLCSKFPKTWARIPSQLELEYTFSVPRVYVQCRLNAGCIEFPRPVSGSALYTPFPSGVPFVCVSTNGWLYPDNLALQSISF